MPRLEKIADSDAHDWLTKLVAAGPTRPQGLQRTISNCSPSTGIGSRRQGSRHSRRNAGIANAASGASGRFEFRLLSGRFRDQYAESRAFAQRFFTPGRSRHTMTMLSKIFGFAIILVLVTIGVTTGFLLDYVFFYPSSCPSSGSSADRISISIGKNAAPAPTSRRY